MPKFSGLSDNPKKALFVILGISFALKIAVWAYVSSHNLELFTWADSRGYHNTAVALHRLGSFAMSVDHPEIPQTYRTPGYPVFLAGIYALWGESWPAAVFVQILLSLGVLTWTFLCARRLWDARIGLLAVLILSLDSISFTYSLKIMSETLFTFFIMAGVYFGVRLVQSRGKIIWALLIGLGVALATMTRPLSLYLVIPLTLGAIILALMGKWGLRRTMLMGLLILLPTMSMVGAWKWRNYRLTGSCVYASIEGFYSYFWQAAAVIAARDGISLEEAQQKLGLGRGGPLERGIEYQKQHPETAGLTFEQLTERWDKEGKAIIGQHPLLFARVYATGIIRMLARPGMQQLLEMIGWEENADSRGGMAPQGIKLLSFGFALLFLLAVYAGVAIFIWQTWRHRSLTSGELLILGVALYMIAFSGGPSAFARFRIPLMPLLALLAACGYRRWRLPERARS